MQTLHGFFTRRADGSRRQWWKLEPHDELVSARPHPDTGEPGHAYCLADSGESYVVYVENTRSVDLTIKGPAHATYRVIQFDPRTAERKPVGAPVPAGKTFPLASPDTEDWAFEVWKD